MRRTVSGIAWMENGPLVVGLGLVVVGIGLLLIGLGFFIGASAPSPGSAVIPDRPAPPLITPANAVLPLEADSLEFTTALSFGGEDASSGQGREEQADGSEQDAEVSDERVLTPIVRKLPVVSELLMDPPPVDAGKSVSEDVRPADPDSSVRLPASSTSLATTYDDQIRRHQQLERKVDADARVTLHGFVMDETLTRLGRDFYSEFFDIWRAPPVEGFYTIRVQETTAPGRGTLIQVLVNADVTFQARLVSGPTGVGEKPLEAARRTYAYIQSGRGTLTIF